MSRLKSISSRLFAGGSSHRRLLLAAFLPALIAALLVVQPPELLRRIDSLSTDFLLRQAAPQEPQSRVFIVEIDEISLAHYGQWPWPRYLLADLVNTIARGGPKAVGLNLVPAGPDRMSLVNIRHMLQQKFSVAMNLDQVAEEVKDNDFLLAEALSGGPFYLGEIFRFGGTSTGGIAAPSPLQLARRGRGHFFPAVDVVAPLPRLAEAAAGSGFLNVQTDEDGIVRRAPLLIEYRNNLHPSMALLLAARTLGVDTAGFTAFGHGNRLQLGGRNIPLDRHGNLAIRFQGGHGSIPTVSAEMVMSGVIPPEIFAGKVVLVGFSAQGLADALATPFSRRVPGTEVQAAQIDTLLEGHFLRTPWWGRPLMGLLLFISIWLACIALLRLSSLGITTGSLALAALFPLLAVPLFFRAGICLPLLTPLLLFGLCFILFALVQFRGEELRSREYERQLASGQESTILGLATIVETRDTHTGHHVVRIRRYVEILAEYMRTNSDRGITLREVELFYKTSVLHDIGKVGVGDDILLKPTRLTSEEFKRMQLHTIFGAEAFETARHLNHNTPGSLFLEMARNIALTHHEKWDGSGYPMGLKGEEIPFGARLVAVADVYDALISRRPYKEGMSHDKAASFIREGSGSHFDPEVVAAFIACEAELAEVARIWDATEHASIRDFAPEVIQRFLEDEREHHGLAREDQHSI